VFLSVSFSVFVFISPSPSLSFCHPSGSCTHLLDSLSEGCQSWGHISATGRRSGEDNELDIVGLLYSPLLSSILFSLLYSSPLCFTSPRHLCTLPHFCSFLHISILFLFTSRFQGFSTMQIALLYRYDRRSLLVWN
jgi:hypothetical protein